MEEILKELEENKLENENLDSKNDVINIEEEKENFNDENEHETVKLDFENFKNIDKFFIQNYDILDEKVSLLLQKSKNFKKNIKLMEILRDKQENFISHFSNYTALSKLVEKKKKK